MRRLLASIFCALVLLMAPGYAQTFPPLGDDATTSLGSFRIQISNTFAGMFNGCPGYNATTHVLQSPTLFDPATVIGRSNPGLDDGDRFFSTFRRGGAIVGTAEDVISYDTLIPPAGFSCYRDRSACFSGTGTRAVTTEIRSLKMTSGPLAVRAGAWYNDPNTPSTPEHASPGRVVSRSGPSNDPTRDFLASSFFDVFVRVDIPACGSFPGATVNNLVPLIVKNDKLDRFPPRVVYLHDASTIVQIVFVNDKPPLWLAGDVLGLFLLAGHGVGFTNSSADLQEFNNFMQSQPDAQCPLSNSCTQPPPPSPAPTPVPTATARPMAPGTTLAPGGEPRR
ncbi:MAG TPA: hypothetical protein VH724_04145 [Candidatus Angelobacter sp.]|nr:hypothetical protein [Candidatus Angelobacter sp.]